MPTRRHVQYSSLPTEDRDNLRFTYTPKSHRKIPWKSIALALFLLLIGILLLSLSYFIFTSHVEGDDSQAYGLLFLGVLAFLPGYYVTRVAYYSWRGAPGYTFASIPDY
ncbi:transmembrane protein 230-like [Panicum virgatum]|nr:transmembrane protein 230-like [Panicum virgatum]